MKKEDNPGVNSLILVIANIHIVAISIIQLECAYKFNGKTKNAWTDIQSHAFIKHTAGGGRAAEKKYCQTDTL